MKHMLNTLYITSKDAYLHKEGETIVVKVDQIERIRVPIHTLESIVCFGPIALTSPLMELCGERNVHISLFSENGRFYARVEGPKQGNVLLRKAQFIKSCDPKFCKDTARSFLAAKIANSRGVLTRAIREREWDPEAEKSLSETVRQLAQLASGLLTATNVDAMRGIEGQAASCYFKVFDHLIICQKDSFSFHERSRRPPMDRVNAMLSFVYTLLAHDVSSSLSGVGLDPAVGYLHTERPGRPSLALDIMEEFRAFLGDRLVLTLINRQQVKPQGFKQTETGAILMDDDTRKLLLTTYQKRKQETIMHPFLDEKIEIGLLPHAQSLLLARYLRGDLDAYPAFFWR